MKICTNCDALLTTKPNRFITCACGHTDVYDDIKDIILEEYNSTSSAIFCVKGTKEEQTNPAKIISMLVQAKVRRSYNVKNKIIKAETENYTDNYGVIKYLRTLPANMLVIHLVQRELSEAYNKVLATGQFILAKNILFGGKIYTDMPVEIDTIKDIEILSVKNDFYKDIYDCRFCLLLEYKLKGFDSKTATLMAKASISFSDYPKYRDVDIESSLKRRFTEELIGSCYVGDEIVSALKKYLSYADILRHKYNHTVDANINVNNNLRNMPDLVRIYERKKMRNINLIKAAYETSTLPFPFQERDIMIKECNYKAALAAAHKLPFMLSLSALPMVILKSTKSDNGDIKYLNIGILFHYIDYDGNETSIILGCNDDKVLKAVNNYYEYQDLIKKNKIETTDCK